MKRKIDPNYLESTFLYVRAKDPDALATLFYLMADDLYVYAWCYLQDAYEARWTVIRTFLEIPSEAETRLLSVRPFFFQKAFAIACLYLKDRLKKKYPEKDEIERDALLSDEVQKGRRLYTAWKAASESSSWQTTNGWRETKKEAVHSLQHLTPAGDPALSFSFLNPSDKEPMLEEILLSSGIKTPLLPFSLLKRNARVKHPHLGFGKFLLSISLIILLLFPLSLIAPKLSIQKEVTTLSGKSGSRRPVYTLRVDPVLLPPKKVNATLNGSEILVRKLEDGSFSLLPDENGQLTLSATLWNNQKRHIDVTVTGVDLTAPELLSYAVKENKVHLYLKDEGSGIDYASIYGELKNGRTLRPVSSFKDRGEVVFDAPSGEMTIYASDFNHNRLKVKIKTF